MGKIDRPVQVEQVQEIAPAVEVEDLGLRETNEDVVDLLSEGTIPTDKPTEFTEDELKYTNETIRLIPIRKALGIDGLDTEHDGKIKDIMTWAKNKGIHNKNHLLSELRKINYKLGYDDGKPKIDRVYQYIRIDSQINSLVNKQVALENE